MGIGLSGLTSGMDTDSIVKALVSTKTYQKEKLQKTQTKLQWKQDAWKDLNKKIYDFYTKSLGNMRLVGNYNKKTTSVSDPTVAKITASSGSVDGTQTLGIKQLAKSGYLTGGQIITESGTKASASTTLSDLGIKSSTTISINGSSITVGADTKISELVSGLKNAGVNASFDSANQRFFISAKESGKSGDFSLTADSSSGINALKSLGLYTGANTSDVAQYSQWAGYSDDAFYNKMFSDMKAAATAAGLQNVDSYSDVDSLITALNSAKSVKQTENTTLQSDIDNLTSQQKKLQTQREYTILLADVASGATRAAEYKADIENQKTTLESKGTLTEEETKKLNELNDKLAAIAEIDTEVAKPAYLDENGQLKAEEVGRLLDKVDSDLNTTTTSLSEKNSTLSSNRALISAYEKAVNIKPQYEAKRETAKNYMIQYNYNNAASYDAMTEEALDKDGNKILDSDGNPITKTSYDAAVAAIGDIRGSSDGGTAAVRIEGQDAIIFLNGAEFTNSTNDFTINGLSITAQEITGTNVSGELNTVSITTTTDTQGIYDMVKDFIKGYNELMTEMSKLYNAESAKGYEPLTDDEKENMSESEIEKWEEKIKGSLLRRDSSLNNIMNVMTSSLSGGVTVDGKKHFLSELGIKTAGYLYATANERNNYHIDGDKDDDLTGSETDKLMAAIIEDPDSVAEMLSGFATTMYDNMTIAMRSTSLSSTYTAYNDKQMQTEYNSYTTKISEMETKIKWWEDYYYKKFSTMETMLAKINAQSSSLSGMLG